ncbi:precorrin-2 dehydrogenase/sirohydrochlorin ferrochelatase family protein [Desulfurispora thermophila]|uniref:precorrin-2 dehydrogenase/sirohydrochlorin ferrochelatase family protein n=1 Tax=Desulfurispora thermophila TaxID=265470 RepID=UPI00036814FB|nr:bifunctional precorrin-2 dehydrogenase/sirohydrochlorin ferrochelatase [Desulfurispora thermophila]
MAAYYHVTINLAGQLCLVVGGGKVAGRKAKTLLECGARIRLVSPQLVPELDELVRRSGDSIFYQARPYQPADLHGVLLVIAATGDVEVNRRIAQECRHRSLLVNVVNDPAAGNFFVPATVRRGALTIAVSTAGKSPLLSRYIRQELESIFPPQYAELVELLGELRAQIISRVQDAEHRQVLLAGLLDEHIWQLVRAGQFELAKERIRHASSGSGAQS